ncbi:leucine-rich repeat extensin-like protein 3 [Iris pallida]|uniref:Leucine-rich repeat extensin-like protein 3 n=1 Tax=Iris pallida TaxID=29817 RepID=A0AAX6GW33_IRIPA|nr:leucine-rich repeat extensin-like protein 3 [Iris pallida]
MVLRCGAPEAGVLGVGAGRRWSREIRLTGGVREAATALSRPRGRKTTGHGVVFRSDGAEGAAGGFVEVEERLGHAEETPGQRRPRSGGGPTRRRRGRFGAPDGCAAESGSG